MPTLTAGDDHIPSRGIAVSKESETDGKPTNENHSYFEGTRIAVIPHTRLIEFYANALVECWCEVRPQTAPLLLGYKLVSFLFTAKNCYVFTISGTHKKYHIGPTKQKDMKIFLLPKGQVEFVDTWDAQGMRGTSSFGFELTDMFVPLNHTYDQDDAEPWHNGPHYIIPRTLLFAAGFSTVALATAKASLNIAVDFASAGQSGRKQTLMREQSTVQRSIGEARAIYSASRAYLRESMSTVWDSACSRGSLTLEERINLRLATTYAIRTAASVVDVCYNLCGSGAIFASNPIQRRFQDIHVITQHLQAHPTNYDSAGQCFLGYEPEGNF